MLAKDHTIPDVYAQAACSALERFRALSFCENPSSCSTTMPK